MSPLTPAPSPGYPLLNVVAKHGFRNANLSLRKSWQEQEPRTAVHYRRSPGIAVGVVRSLGVRLQLTGQRQHGTRQEQPEAAKENTADDQKRQPGNDGTDPPGCPLFVVTKGFCTNFSNKFATA
jgi:hypothetical protein